MLPSHLLQRLFRRRQVGPQLAQVSQRRLLQQKRLVAHRPEVHVVEPHAVPQPRVLDDGLQVHDAVGEVGEHRNGGGGLAPIPTSVVAIAVDRRVLAVISVARGGQQAARYSESRSGAPASLIVILSNF